MMNNEKDEDNVVNYNYTFMQLYRIKKANIFWKIVDELACRIDKIANIYEKYIGNEYRRERKKFGLSKAKKILHIGCGSYPITAMVLAEINDVNIVTIDNNARAVKLANKVIRMKNLDGKIRVKHGYGTKYPLEEFDTIIISSCSVPKTKVLEYVLKNAKLQSRIILRDSFLDIESIIDNLNIHQNITIVEKIENHPIPSIGWKSFYLLKK